jgi:hypothetical protein
MHVKKQHTAVLAVLAAVIAIVALAVTWWWRTRRNQRIEGIGGGGPRDPRADVAIARSMTHYYMSLEPVIQGMPSTFALTWYSWQDNTPCNSMRTASGNRMVPFISVAVPFRFLAKFGGALNYGDLVYVPFLRDRVMPNSTKHTGYLVVTDFCGDNSDDNYCYSDDGKKNPILDVYIGDYTKARMNRWSGPMGNGQETVYPKFYKAVARGKHPSVIPRSYGGQATGGGRCGDCEYANKQQPGAWDYDNEAQRRC